MLKYQFIVQAIQRAVLSGTLRPGQKLDSIREACQRYQCNKSTVIRGYQELENLHFITSRNKSGYYVLDTPRSFRESKEHVIDFAMVELEKDRIPYQDLHHCINNAIEKEKADLFCYTHSTGLDSLILQIQKELMSSQIFAQRNQIIITSGIQQALSLLCRMPFYGGRDTIVVEQPTFKGIIYALRHARAEAIGIERTYDGLDLNRLEHVFRTGRIKFFYVQPRYQNPLGTHLSETQKKDLLTLAYKYNVYLVEDDYMSEFDLVKSRLPLAANHLDQVIYLQSFSKILVPGIRTGVAVLPEELVKTFSEYKQWSDLSSSLITQGALDVYLRSGLMNPHTATIRKVYSERMDTVRQIMDTRCPHPYFVPDCCLFFSIELPPFLCIETLLATLKSKGILLSGISEYYLEGFKQRKNLRVTVSNAGPSIIRSYLPQILNAINNGSSTRKEPNWL